MPRQRWTIAAACLLSAGLLMAAGCGGGNDDETYAPTWEPPEVDRAIANLQGLPFDEFIETQLAGA